MTTTGYSGTPLAKKLGIKAGYRIRVADPPLDYFDLLEELPENVTFIKDKNSVKDLVHYFTKDIGQLQTDIQSLRNEIFPDGSLWISWPKKTSGIASSVSEDGIREIALKNGLVDIKVCAVDNIWSGLKLVIPLKNRKTAH